MSNLDVVNPSKPIFSIIIPTRNRVKLLKRSIDSVKDQEFENWELNIIDDGSEDSTRHLVSSYQDERINYYYQAHQERSSARNHGIEVSKGRYICFVDDDDYVSKHYLSDFFAYYDDNNFPSVILRTGFFKEDHLNTRKSDNYNPIKHKNPVYFASFNMCGIWSLCIPRQFLTKEQFPEAFPHWQDTHLILRLLLKHEFVQQDTHNYFYVIHEQMGSKQSFSKFDPVQRANLNVEAFEDLFASHGSALMKFLPKGTLKFLKAEKFIEYSNNTLRRGNKSYKMLLRKSLRNGFYIALWKHYVMHLLLKLRIK